MSRDPSARGGYLLFEAAVATTILTIGLMAVYQAMGAASEVRALARDRSVVRFLIEQKMAEMELASVLDVGKRSGTFASHPRFTWESEVDLLEVPLPQLAPNLPVPILQEILQEGLEMPVNIMGRVRVTVSWRRLGQPYSESAETLFSEVKLPARERAEFRRELQDEWERLRQEIYAQIQNRREPQSIRF